MIISEFTIDRHEEVLALLSRTPGVVVREADSRDAIERYLRRNPGLSFVAEVDGRLVGCAMCGHDGRRGYLQHVAVDLPHRSGDIALKLVARCLDGLARAGITKAHLDVLVTNQAAQDYWTKRGWIRRDDIYRFSISQSPNPNV